MQFPHFCKHSVPWFTVSEQIQTNYIGIREQAHIPVFRINRNPSSHFAQNNAHTSATMPSAQVPFVNI